MNICIMIGRLTRDPELRTTQDGTSVCNITLAVDRWAGRDGQKQADFIPVVCWRHTADFVSKYFFKGTRIAVSGRLQIRSYTDRDGFQRTAAEIVADNAEFADGKREQPRYNQGSSYDQDHSNIPPDDDIALPFDLDL